jgi:hypothetical protein
MKSTQKQADRLAVGREVILEISPVAKAPMGENMSSELEFIVGICHQATATEAQ